MGEGIQDAAMHGLYSLCISSPLFAWAWRRILEEPLGMDQHPLIFAAPVTIGYMLCSKDYHMKPRDLLAVYVGSAASYTIVHNFLPEIYNMLF